MKRIALLTLAGVLACAAPTVNAAEIIISAGPIIHHHHDSVLVHESTYYERDERGHRILVTKRVYERWDGSRYSTYSRVRV